jgi:hypothetical protein
MNKKIHISYMMMAILMISLSSIASTSFYLFSFVTFRMMIEFYKRLSDDVHPIYIIYKNRSDFNFIQPNFSIHHFPFVFIGDFRFFIK